MDNEYAKIVTSEYREKPKAEAFLKAKLSINKDLINLVLNMPQEFDLDKAVGKQLDILGEIVGASRIVSISDT